MHVTAHVKHYITLQRCVLEQVIQAESRYQTDTCTATVTAVTTANLIANSVIVPIVLLVRSSKSILKLINEFSANGYFGLNIFIFIGLSK